MAARRRDDDLTATAPPAERVLALEVPGPWAPGDALDAGGLGRDVVPLLRVSAAAAGVRVLLVRRPGRHPRVVRPRVWFLADLATGGLGAGSWTAPDDVLAVDLGAPVPPHDGPPVLLVCTHARHDQCCAIDGLPLARALAADGRCPVWEASHLGGDRFAANVLALPSGDLYGRLAARDAGRLVDAVLDGRLLTEHHRGRCGVPVLEQAVHSLALRAFGQDRPGAVVVESVESFAGVVAARVRHAGRRYDVVVHVGSSPAARLTCAGTGEVSARTFRLAEVSRPR